MSIALRPCVKFALGLASVLAAAAPCFAQEADANEAAGDDAPRILLLNSYHQGYEWTDGAVEGLQAAIARDCPHALLYVEYMDSKRFWDGQDGRYAKGLAERYRRKYGDLQPDVIVSTDDNAFQFLLQRGEDLFPGVPVVFCGVNDFSDEMIAGRAEFTGVVEKLDPKATVDLALSLSPEAKRVAIVTDTTPTGLSNRAYMMRMSPDYADRAPFVFLDETGEGLTLRQLLARLRALPPDSVVLYYDFFRDRDGRFLDPAEVMPRVSAASPAPVYSMGSFYLGKGIVGGKITRSYDQGREAGVRACRILEGESPADIPVLYEGANRYIFDARQLGRFGIDESRLPPGSTVLHRRFSFYEAYKSLVWSVAGVVTLLLLLIAVMAVNMQRRRRAEQNLRVLFEGVPDAVFVHDREGRFVYCNEVACRRMGYTREQFLKMRTSDIDEEQFGRGFEERLGRQFRDGRLACEGVHVTKDGRHVPVDINTSVINFEGRKAVLAVVRDISERKQAERALRESERRLREAQDLARIGRWELDIKADRLAWSDGIYEMFEVDPEHFGASYEAFMSFVHPDDREAVDRAFRRSLADRTPYEISHRLLMPDGRVKYVHERGRTEYDQQDEPVKMTGTVQDITESELAEQQRRDMERQLQHAQKLESLGVLAGGIAHDFNNLLVGILGYADLGLSEVSEISPARRSLGEIKKAAVRASELTNQMLAYSGKGRFIVRPIDLNELVREMTHLLEVSISKKTVLKYDLADELPAVEADATQMRQVVMNLITNASDAIGDRSGGIIVSTGVMELDRKYIDTTYVSDDLPEGYYVYLEVSDSGCGMDAETRQRIFEPFFTTKFAGRGLGLAAVLGIVRGHRGAVKVYSEPGKGTTFRVLLPCSEKSVESLEPEGTAAAEEGWKADGAILVVDDEESVRSVAKMMLERRGFEVLTAEDGKAALEVFGERPEEISLVILDMTMPRMNGEETFRELRRVRPGVRVLLTSGYNEQDATNRFAGKGLAGFIQKPFQMDKLLEKVRGILEGA